MSTTLVEGNVYSFSHTAFLIGWWLCCQCFLANTLPPAISSKNAGSNFALRYLPLQKHTYNGHHLGYSGSLPWHTKVHSCFASVSWVPHKESPSLGNSEDKGQRSREKGPNSFQAKNGTKTQNTRSFWRNTKHLIQLLEKVQIEKGPAILATADLNSLYTIIRHQDAIGATKWALRQMNDLRTKQTYLVEYLDYCLSHNYIWHNRMLCLCLH